MLQRNDEVRLDPDLEFLLRVREVLEERGWCQDKLSDQKTGAVCLVGAGIKAAHPDNRFTCINEKVASDRLRRLLQLPWSTQTWNDGLPTGDSGKRRLLARLDVAIDWLTR